MRRRRGSPLEKSAVGIANRDKAISKIDDMFQRSVSTMVPYPLDLSATLDCCFKPDVLATMKAAYALRRDRDYRYWGSKAMFEHDEDLRFEFTTEDTKMFIPDDDYFEIDPIKGKRLLDWFAQVQEIASKFNKAEWVLRWLDKNATAGAIRYYWPSVLSILPENAPISMEPPARFVTPAGIHDMLPWIRETSSTIASALLLNEIELPPKCAGLKVMMDENTTLSLPNITRIISP